jgi:predicted metal-dependent hydrolase
MEHDREALFARGIELFNTREFFECHEVLEEIWTPTVQPERWFLQSLIHFAVGFYHHQRGNTVGAVRQLRKGLRKIEGYLPAWGGVDTGAIESKVRACLSEIENGGIVEQFPAVHRTGRYSA